MKSLYKICCVFAALSVCGYSFISCSDDEEVAEPKEKVFSFAADGTPELIGDNGLDFNAMYDEFNGEFIDITSYRKYKINDDGSVNNVGVFYFGSDTPSYPGSLTCCQYIYHWDETGLKVYDTLRWVCYDFLNYPVNAEQEKTFFAKFKVAIPGQLVKFADGYLGFVYKDRDGSWYFYDGVGAYNKYLKKEIIENIEKYGRQGGPIYDPEL